MSRLIAGSAALLAATALTVGLAGCKDSSTSSAPAPAPATTAATTAGTDPATDSDQTPPDDVGTTPSAPSDTTPAPAGGGGGAVCDDVAYVTKVVGDLQQKTPPGDAQAVADRLNKFVSELPAEIQRPGQGVSGPIIISLRHPEVAGEVSTDAVKQDVVELNAWHDKNC
jgi:hypothetical protein